MIDKFENFSLNEYGGAININYCEIYFNTSKNCIAIHKAGEDELNNMEFKSVDEALKFLYEKNSKCNVTIVPHEKFAYYIIKNTK